MWSLRRGEFTGQPGLLPEHKVPCGSIDGEEDQGGSSVLRRPWSDFVEPHVAGICGKGNGGACRRSKVWKGFLKPLSVAERVEAQSKVGQRHFAKEMSYGKKNGSRSKTLRP